MSPHEPREECDEPLGEWEAAFGCTDVGVACEFGDFDRGGHFDGLATSDCERACFVGAGNASGALGGVEAGTFGRAVRLVAKVGIPDARLTNREQKFDRHAIRDEPMVNES